MKHHQVRVFWATLGQTQPTVWLCTQYFEMTLSKKLQVKRGHQVQPEVTATTDFLLSLQN